MGYGTRALEQLIAYYQGNITNLKELDGVINDDDKNDNLKSQQQNDIDEDQGLRDTHTHTHHTLNTLHTHYTLHSFLTILVTTYIQDINYYQLSSFNTVGGVSSFHEMEYRRQFVNGRGEAEEAPASAVVQT